MNKAQTLFFTGHRTIPAAQELANTLESTVLSFVNKGYRYFVAGGALGFDTLAADCIIKLKAKGLDIKLILMLPCKNQSARWSRDDILKYENHLEAADEVIYVSEAYTNWCMFARNRAMADASSACIAYCNKPDGGSAYTVKYASSKGITVVNLAVGEEI